MSNQLQRHINEIADKLLPMEEYQKLGEYEALINNTPDSIKCPKCGWSEINLKEIQTRSSDETGTKIFTCLRCHFKWRQT